MGQYGSSCSCLSRAKPIQASTWEEIAPTLRRGDIVLMCGTAAVSKLVANGQFVYSALNAKAKEYSHIAIVVEPPFPPGASEETVKGRPGPWFAEAIDNDDISVIDVTGEAKYKQVHIVQMGERIFGKQNGRDLYSKVAVRRLQDFEWTDERIQSFAKCLERIKGRRLNQSVRVLTDILYDAGHPKDNAITCVEVVVELYKAVGILPPVTNGRKYGPVHFTDCTRQIRMLEGSLGPEEVLLQHSMVPMDAPELQTDG